MAGHARPNTDGNIPWQRPRSRSTATYPRLIGVTDLRNDRCDDPRTDEPRGLQASLTSDEQIEVSPHYQPCMMSCTALRAHQTQRRTVSTAREQARGVGSSACVSAMHISFQAGSHGGSKPPSAARSMSWVVMERSPSGRGAAEAAASASADCATQKTAPLRLHTVPSLTIRCCWLILAASRQQMLRCTTD